MAITTASGTSTVAQDLWQQLSLQQARRSAQQAELTARTLQTEASDARAAANRALENARDLEVKANQAQSSASQAAQNLVLAQSSGFVQAQLGSLNSHLTSSPPQGTPAVVNTQGQTLGTVVNVTA